MGALFRSGVALIVLGFILIGAGYYMLAHPGSVKERSVVERQVVVWFGSAKVDPGAYVYKEFTVPSGAEDPRLELTLAVKGGQGNDIDVRVETAGGEELYDEKVSLYAERTVALPGAGLYKLVLSNTFSLVSTKYVKGNATLVYGEPVINERESETAGVTVAMAGWAILGLGMIIAAIARIRGWMSRKRF